uniref:Response regulatory domain-containing protein n=1 Tax=Kalanchoe fedtschenkoi TaxID=63787 RepID=A0A7N0VFX5_KALFE
MAGYASSDSDSCNDDNMTEHCSNARILLWDSSGRGCGGLPALLHSCSYEVTHVSSPEELLASLETEARCIDFILINFHNHVVDRSMDVLKHLTRRCDIPVTVLLEASQVPLLGKCLQMGASDYLVKPLRAEELSTLWKRSAFL